MPSRPSPPLPREFVMELRRGEDHPDWYVVRVRGTPVVSQGRGVSDAIANGHEALAGYLELLEKKGVRVRKRYDVKVRVPRAA